MDYYKATCSQDHRLDFEHNDFGQFAKMAWLVTKPRGAMKQVIDPRSWSFEGGGVELDPVEDLGLDAALFE